MHRIYQAGPLFSDAERAWHRTLSACLALAGHSVVWPGNLLAGEQIKDAGPAAIPLIFDTCRKAVEQSTCVVALLDGTQVDDGTAWEIGYAYAKGIPIYDIRTDFRQAGDTRYNSMNSMIEGCLSGLAGRVEDLLLMLQTAWAGPNISRSEDKDLRT